MRNLLRILFILIVCVINCLAIGQNLISGPVLGPVELRTATILLEVSSKVKKVKIKYWAVKSDSGNKLDPGNYEGAVDFKGILGNAFNPIKLVLTNLRMNTEYQYKVILNNKEVKFNYTTKFKTKELWQWRKLAPDFSFLTGSCAYFNEPVFDRPGKPYGGDSTIFKTMTDSAGAFMLWLGDNWYYREADYFDEWGFYYRPSKERSLPILQKLWSSTSHYAIWDDHDYGANDADKTNPFKEVAREVFMAYWANPSYGENNKAIYTKFSYSDVDFFLLDDRWFRSNDRLKDTINGAPNINKKMFGDEQMDWLKNSLIGSNASFKFIVTGSQVLNPLSPWDCLRHFPSEYQELIDFLSTEQIKGVVFLTGDKHISEVIKLERAGKYPLFDLTISALTSGSHKFTGPEKASPYRIYGLAEKQNFGKISVTGITGKRKLTCRFIGVNGENYGEWSINQEDLK